MSDFNLKQWRQRFGFNEIHAATELGLTVSQYYAYENNQEEIPEYIELAAFGLELSEVLWIRATEQHPQLKALGQSYSYARAQFLDHLIIHRKLLFSLQLDKSHPLYFKNFAYLSSDEFLEEYFKELVFDEPYAKAFGTIALGWVTSPWRHYIKESVFKYTRDYLKKHKKLPEGEVAFDVNWKTKKPKWLVNSLKRKQVVTFPKINEVKYD